MCLVAVDKVVHAMLQVTPEITILKAMTQVDIAQLQSDLNVYYEQAG
jgi:hypothetical protein